ncbi:hypothetical protein VTL71DRAFT_13897 [Oculimacula yallundae]|uniref:Uncharacterized protein n=1 Tax=Oculimacula yallundae TaxID=86028 RepID=A0ABR4CLN1_9HELO
MTINSKPQPSSSNEQHGRPVRGQGNHQAPITNIRNLNGIYVSNPATPFRMSGNYVNNNNTSNSNNNNNNTNSNNSNSNNSSESNFVKPKPTNANSGLNNRSRSWHSTPKNFVAENKTAFLASAACLIIGRFALGGDSDVIKIAHVLTNGRSSSWWPFSWFGTIGGAISGYVTFQGYLATVWNWAPVVKNVVDLMKGVNVGPKAL